MEERQIADRIRRDLVPAPVPDPTPARIAEDIPARLDDRNAFIFAAYRIILGREASPVEILHHARRLRFLPFVYTRRSFLDRLRHSWEAIAFQTRTRHRHEAELRDRIDALESRCERAHAQLREQIRALQRSVTEVSYEIVEDIVERQKSAGSPS